ncbi:MAG: ribosomal protein S18 acetylase RimI-like enzyme [Candidatus Azotimanducaceae bacterium]|jgi:ribosomal protein S18 acetylase RimI-like enzyme
MPSIRKAELADARFLSLFAESTFRDTFSSENTSEDMNLHCRKYFSEEIQKEEILNTNRATLLSIVEDKLVGYTQLHWGEFPSCVPANFPGEIQRLYIDSPWHGRGVAQDLMNAAIAEMINRGSDAVCLGVWENNPRAISFYEKLGFKKCGSKVFQLGTDPQTDIIMTRSLLSA